ATVPGQDHGRGERGVRRLAGGPARRPRPGRSVGLLVGRALPAPGRQRLRRRGREPVRQPARRSLPDMSPPAVRHFVGLDLGQPHEFTALAVLERPLVSAEDVLARRRPAYALRHLQRFPLGTPYPAVVRSVVALLRTPALSGATLAVDQTGVGRAVVEML